MFLEKIQLNLPPTVEEALVNNVTHDYTKSLFGPITPRKLKVKLVNDKGINLNVIGFFFLCKINISNLTNYTIASSMSIYRLF